ncbi:NADH-quinone oxidoreductase subunit NuoK [Shewanella surugensis]|uniref:NADH-quinone oxidoreductase subunit K n=1 Tax=Shewanella surugensis TaxID=212020 RepID=A0ABT0L8R2_9GAMM|nr:NADH-quinone oxidoreductase subunit NuoK [Shewanella surugensis]MCL1124087.1 NADH-quinone oxidoreductase subunit NuoK [Shewanella surugensis]
MNLSICVSLSLFLFFIGLTVVLVRKEFLFILMGMEIMFNGAALTAVIGAQHWQDPFGQVLTLFIMIIAGVELTVSLLIVMHCYRTLKISNIDELKQLHD